eukprot:319568-Pyramimonas_sp.AAC.1
MGWGGVRCRRGWPLGQLPVGSGHPLAGADPRTGAADAVLHRRSAGAGGARHARAPPHPLRAPLLPRHNAPHDHLPARMGTPHAPPRKGIHA